MRPSRRWNGALALTAAVVTTSPALGYEGSTTLAGLTEQAAMSSRLHRRVVERFALSLGIFEPLQLDPAQLSEDRARNLFVRLRALDAGQGHALELLPCKTGQNLAALRQHVLGWLAAGAVLETHPALRVRHHFVDGKTGRGLRRQPGVTAMAASADSVEQGISTVRQLLSGAAMDGTGLAAPDWIESPDNDLGLSTFVDAYERAVTAETATARETALVEVLLSAGAMLAVLEQTGDPAYVHNDLGAVLAGPFAHQVAERYGRAGVPAPDAKLQPDPPQRFRELLFDGKGGGLAERTASRFLSVGSITRAAVPTGTKLIGSGGYLSTPTLKHWLAWAERPALVEGGRAPAALFLDDRCFADYASVLLPEVGKFAQVGLDFLLRGDLRLSLTSDSALQVKLLDEQLGSGTLTVLGEKASGERQVLKSVSTLPSRPGVLGSVPLGEEALKDLVRLVVLWKGRDHHNQPLLTSAQLGLRKAEAAPTVTPAPEAATE